MRKLELGSWDYDDYLEVSGRKDNDKTKTRWLEVIALINSKYYESIDNEIRETVNWIDNEILEEGI